VFAESTIRRLERFRSTGKLGWQRSGPFDADTDWVVSGKPRRLPATAQ
jgi:hypothetical protein